MRYLDSKLRAALPLLTTALLLGACDEASVEDPVELDATGQVSGLLFLDRNGTNALEQSDQPVEDWVVQLVQPGGAVVGTDTTSEGGEFVFREVPVGRLQIFLPPEQLGDSLVLINADSTFEFTLQAESQAVFVAAVTYPDTTIEAVRELEPGRRVFTEGIVLNPIVAGVDELHVTSGDHAIRVLVDTRVSLAVGDSVRVLGTTGRLDGQPVLTDGEIIPLGRLVRRPDPAVVSTATAADAGEGDLDAELVEVQEARLVSYETFATDSVTAVVNDGSGPVGVVFRPYLNLNANVFDTEQDVVFPELTGLLVPFEETGSWRLVPRGGGDISIQLRDPSDTVPEFTVAEVRDIAAGQLVATTGVALNRLVTGVGELHIQGQQEALRLVNVEQADVREGDTVRVVGTTARRQGEPVLTDVDVTVQSRTGPSVTPIVVSTARADSAAGGALDARLVQIDGAVVQSYESFITALQNDSVSVVVDDGSGPIEVAIRPQYLQLDTAALSPPDPQTQETVFPRLRGLLVPAPPRPSSPQRERWYLVPRTGADLCPASGGCIVYRSKSPVSPPHP